MPKRKRGSVCWSSRAVLRKQRMLRQHRDRAMLVFGPRQLINMCATHRTEELPEALAPYDGKCLPIAWPCGTVLVLGPTGIEDIFSDINLRDCETNYLGRYERMALIGCARIQGSRYPITITDLGRVYAYDEHCDALYEVADDINMLLTEGLIRFDPVIHPVDQSSIQKSGEIMFNLKPLFFDKKLERDGYVKSRKDFRLLLQAFDASERAAYVRGHRGETLALSWPADRYLKINDAHSLGISCIKLLSLQDAISVHPEPLGVLGTVESPWEDGSAVAILVILVGDSGRVFIHMFGSQRDIVQVAPSMQDFVRVGLSKLIGHYRYQNVGSVSSIMSAVTILDIATSNSKL